MVIFLLFADTVNNHVISLLRTNYCSIKTITVCFPVAVECVLWIRNFSFLFVHTVFNVFHRIFQGRVSIMLYHGRHID